MESKTLSGLCAVAALLILPSCIETIAEEEIAPAEPEKFTLVEDALKPYFQRFEDEARTRGIEVNLTASGIRGVIREIDESRVAGRCSYRAGGAHLITIDQTFWRNSTDLLKEFIVFHELGHCYLGRGHLETQFASGACVSIMRSGNESCRDYYNATHREYYIDELFFPDDSAPVIANR